MSELARLSGRGNKGDVTLVLTETCLQLEPSPEFRSEIEESFREGQEESQKAPKAIAWFVGKVLNFAASMVAKVWEPHTLDTIDLDFLEDHVVVKMGRIHFNTSLTVTPEHAYIFRAKFEQAKAAYHK